MSDAAPILSASGIRKTYTMGRVKVPVLRGTSIDVRAGECVAILGASGSGKSTFLHLLGGLDRPDRAGRNDEAKGRIIFGDVEITRLGQRELNVYRTRSVGFVFQFYHLLPELSVRDNTLLPAMVKHGRLGFSKHKADLRTRAETLLDRFGLAHRLNHHPAELSGGERQRVAIARALINEPPLLLADEPTGNLDETTGASILDAMMEFKSQTNQTMVIVTHDKATAERADRIVRLKDGAVVEQQ